MNYYHFKKLILDCCSKTAFSFDEQFYVQNVSMIQIFVSMGSSLGPVLANIILTEFERLIVCELIADGTIVVSKGGFWRIFGRTSA